MLSTLSQTSGEGEPGTHESLPALQVPVFAQAPTPHEVGKLLDPSWLLEHRLTGGAETTVGDRRGYRFAVAADAPMDGFPFSVDDVVADAHVQQRSEALLFNTVHVTSATSGQLVALGQEGKTWGMGDFDTGPLMPNTAS